MQKTENEGDPQKADALNRMKNSEEIMRSFLLGNRYNLDRIENHILFFDVAETASGFERPNSLFLGSVFSNAIILEIAGEQYIYILSNLSGVLIITIFKKCPQDKLYNTFVKNESGKVNPPQKVGSILWHEFNNLQRLREKYNQGLSPNQRKLIEEKIKNDPEGFMKSGTYKRRMLDQNLK